MRPEIKYRLIERLIQTEDDEILKQVELLLDGDTTLTEEHQRTLDERLIAYEENKTAGSPWEEVRDRIKKQL